MTIRHLRVFHTVCRHMSMTAAAKELFLTQSAVSQAIKELEEYYHTVLFERYPRRIELTEAGKVLDEIASGILLSYNEIGPMIAGVEDSGNLRIGANLSVGTTLIHQFIKEYKKKYPRMDLQMNVTRGSVLIEQLYNSELDLLLMESTSKYPDLVVEPFYDDKLVIVGAPDNPLTEKKNVSLEMVCREKLLLRERGAGVRDQFEHIMQAHGINVRPAMESSSTTALVRAVNNGMGIAVLPYLLVKEALDSGMIKEIKVKDISLSRELSLIYHSKKHITRSMYDFMEIVRQSKITPDTYP